MPKSFMLENAADLMITLVVLNLLPSICSSHTLLYIPDFLLAFCKLPHIIFYPSLPPFLFLLLLLPSFSFLPAL